MLVLRGDDGGVTTGLWLVVVRRLVARMVVRRRLVRLLVLADSIGRVPVATRSLRGPDRAPPGGADWCSDRVLEPSSGAFAWLQ